MTETKEALTEPITMPQIELATRAYAAARLILEARVIALNAETKPHYDEIAASQKEHLPGIRSAIESVSDKRVALENAIANSKGLFDSPRTVTFHGVDVGLHSGNGAVEIKNPKRTVALIEQHLKPLAGLLIKTEKSPIKTTIGKLQEDQLKKIEARIVGKGDHVVISAVVSSDLEQTVQTLLNSAIESKKS